MKTYGVIMAGGGGTRFWPLSRQEKPKQFLNLSGKNTMVMDTVDRLLSIANAEDIFVVTNKMYQDATIQQTKGVLRDDHILGEPAARNTAACIGYAAMEIVKKYEDGIMCIVPSDHFIKNEAEYTRVMKKAINTAIQTDKLVTIGIKPTFPSTGYGYIRCEKKEDMTVYPVKEFVEKPDIEHAKQYLSLGQYSWNSGMFVWKASTILGLFEQLLPDIYSELVKIGNVMGTKDEQKVIEEIYPEIQKISIDYGIMERAKDVLMLEGDFGWNDVGSFDALEEIYTKDENGNINLAYSLAIDSTDCIFYGNDNRLIATLGVKDLIVAQTDDVILVCDKSRAQEVKKFTEQLKEIKKEEYL